MADEPSKRSIEWKDVAIFLPVMGSALAVSYEIGVFMPIGMSAFGLFSLTEHLLWSLPAIPLLVGMPIAVFVADALFNLINHKIRKTHRGPREGRKIRLKLRAISIFSFAFASMFVGLAVYFREAFWIAMSLPPYGIALALISPKKMFTRRNLVGGVAVTLIVLAMAQGLDGTRIGLGRACPATFVVDGSPLQATLIRAGERGLLLYDRPTQKFSFLKWDAFKRVDWSRFSLKRPRAC